MREERFRVAVPQAGSVTAARLRGDGAGWTFIYAPGAGSRLDDPFGVYASRVLAGHGVTCIRFQFPYMEAGRRSPDRPSVLEATWEAVIEAMRGDSRLVVGGRSMGGRVASQVVARGVKVDALVLFAYPLHPPGKQAQRRDDHFGDIKVRSLFCSGTNDAFAAPEELREAAARVKRSSVHLIDGADHGFAVRKSSGRTRDDVYAEAVAAMARWLKL